MKKITLITFLKEDSTNSDKMTFLRIILKKFSELFKRKKINDFLKEYQLYEDLTMNVIELPYRFEELQQKGASRAAKLLLWVCERSGIERCIIPEELSGAGEINALVGRNLISYKGDILFRSLIGEVLKGLVGSNEGSLYGYDVIIVEGDSRSELFDFIRYLLPLVKYLNVFTGSREDIEDEVNNIYEESGLSIGITSDCLYAFKNADIIINLGDLTEMGRRPRIKNGALIINYGKLDRTVIPNACTVINGIDVNMPTPLIPKVPRSIRADFNRVEIAEMVICGRLEIGYEIKGKNIGLNLMMGISNEFNTQKYSISGFMGLHGRINPGQYLEKSSSKSSQKG